jgi:hemolysin activation/secretion protein
MNISTDSASSIGGRRKAEAALKQRRGQMRSCDNVAPAASAARPSLIVGIVEGRAADIGAASAHSALLAPGIDRLRDHRPSDLPPAGSGRARGRSRVAVKQGRSVASSIVSFHCWIAVLALASGLPVAAVAADAQPAPSAPAATSAPASEAPPPVQHLDINEYRIEGVHILSQKEVEAAVYPYLGPNRTSEDVEKARAALEKIYNAKGYQTVAVEIPQQQVKNGIVTLKVVEGKVGRLTVKGSHYYSLDVIKEQAPSLAEGTVPNFNDVQQDIVNLNMQPDRKVTPTLRAGVTPGTVDVDLNVEDTLPLHGSLEINNRYSQNTTPLRLNATLSYDNLWQLGHSLSLSYQVAPENPTDAQVFSGSYLARLPDLSWLSILVYGLDSNSNVSTIGATNVAGKGQVVGTRAVITLPSEQGFFQTLNAGIDYKHFDENVGEGGSSSASPVTYFPVTATYNATWQGEKSLTQFDAGVTIDMRGLGSSPEEFDAKRYDAGGDFTYFKADASRTQELPANLQLFGKVQGQLANEPLVNSEQFSGGGQDTVRGYLESEVLADNGVIGSLELRSPSLAPWVGSTVDEWRFFVFSEGGTFSIYDPLPEQQSLFTLASVGAGSRFQVLQYLNGYIDVAVPLLTGPATNAFAARIDFRVWAAF